MDMMLYTCDECNAQFKVKSNLTRHKKIHEGKTLVCEKCQERFRLPQHLRHHQEKHFLPVIPIYVGKNGEEPRLARSDEARQYSETPQSSKIVDNVWRDPVTAEARAREVAGEMWRTQVVLTFGTYTGKSIQWLLSNAVGYSVWLAAQLAGWSARTQNSMPQQRMSCPARCLPRKKWLRSSSKTGKTQLILIFFVKNKNRTKTICCFAKCNIKSLFFSWFYFHRC